MQQIIKYTYRY